MSEANVTKEKKPAIKYPAIPEKLTDIDSQYIKDYIADKYEKGEISKEEVLKWAKKYEECVAEKDKRTFFMPFREAFATDYFPELFEKKGKKKKKTVLTDEQIAEVKRVYNSWQSVDTTLYQDVPEFCKSVKVLKKDKVNPEDVSIEDKDWSLAPSKYIEFIDHDLDIDYKKEMARIQDEMRLLMASEELSQSMLKDAFRGIGYGIN